MAHRELVLVAQPVLDDSLARARELVSPGEAQTVEPSTPDQDLPESLARDCTALFADAVPANVEAGPVPGQSGPTSRRTHQDLIKRKDLDPRRRQRMTAR